MARRRSLPVSDKRPLSLTEYSSTQADGRSATPHPPAQLVQLAQAKALGVLNHHQAEALGTSTPTSITVVDTSTPMMPAVNSFHHGLFLSLWHARVQQAHRHAGQGLAQIGSVAVAF